MCPFAIYYTSTNRVRIATPTFRDRGLAALRRGNRGDLILDRGLQARKPRSLRVRVQHADRIVGTSKIVPLELAPGNDAIENHIRLTRDALYEEELFHELNREARTLLQHGIESKENLIQLPADSNQQILIDMVEPEECNIWDTDKQGHAEDALAETVAQSLRILLSHAHRQKYRRRTQIPPPVTSKRRANPEYSLLRPIVSYLRHKSALEWLKLFLSNITRTLQLAGLNCKYNISPLVSVKFPLVDTSNPSPWELDTPPFVERLVNSFLTPFESIVTGTLLSPTSIFKIRIVTNINPSAFGTEFEIGSNISSSPRTKSSSSRFGLRDDLQQLLLHLFTIDLVYLIPHLARDAGTEPSSLRPNTSLLKQEQGQEQEQPEQSGFNTPTPRHTSHLTSWIPTSPENGELTVFSPSQRRNKKLTIDLHPDKLTVRCQWLRSEIDVDGNMDWEMSTGEGDVIYWWGDGGGNEGKTLQSIVGLMSQEAIKAEL